MQRLRGLFAGFAVGIPLAAFMVVWLQASPQLGALLAGFIGVAIFAVVASRSDKGDLASDVAWRAAASDLPPTAERAAMELAQTSIPAPGKPRRRGATASPSAPKDGGDTAT
jgi:hypothetical protein